ncbi:MAG: hypothetical protein CMO80_12995 [Verrucomicrobiales bacterium]|nr:hypothetical protein [Verrucomicrobiales bacterium]
MSFLTPLFLFGTLAIAAPIYFHLIRRTSKEKTPFSSIMFLQPSPPRVTKRSRLEHILLLLLRCLILALLALGFARPFLPDLIDQKTDKGEGIRTLVLLDASASMQRAGLWEAAKERVDGSIAEAGIEDAIAIYTFGREFEALITFEQWAETPVDQRASLARNRLKEAEPGWSATGLGNALSRAASILDTQEDEEEDGQKGRLILVSDLQQGAYLDELQAFEWPEKLQLKLATIEAGAAGNSGIQFLPSPLNATRTTKATHQKVRVYNTGDSEQEQFKVAWGFQGDKELGQTADIYVPPGQSRVVEVERPKNFDDSTKLLLLGDAENFDNNAWLIPPKPRQVRILYIGDEHEEDTRQPLFFLKQSFPTTSRNNFNVTSMTNESQLFLVQNPYSLIVATDVLTDYNVKQIRNAVQAGATLLLAPRSKEAIESYLVLLQSDIHPIEEVAGSGYALLGEIDFKHPLFSAFTDPRFSDFTKISFWRYRRFDAAKFRDAHVIARFDNDDPAIIQQPIGHGSAYLLASCWHPFDSQFALSSKFVPIMHTILETAGALAVTPSQYLVGDHVVIPFTNNIASVTVTTPEGKNLELEEGQSLFRKTRLPGAYTMTSGTNTLRFAVNIDPRESRTEALPTERLEQFGVVLQNVVFERTKKVDEKRLKNSEIENRQKLWRWLIVGALMVLSLEVLMAGRLSRPVPAGI